MRGARLCNGGVALVSANQSREGQSDIPAVRTNHLCGLGMVVAYIVGLAELVVAALVAASIMVLGGCLDVHTARQAIKWDVYVTIACRCVLVECYGVKGTPESVLELRKIPGFELERDQ
eukprot:8515626-Pyramimonas_sp.AAC.1